MIENDWAFKNKKQDFIHQTTFSQSVKQKGFICLSRLQDIEETEKLVSLLNDLPSSRKNNGLMTAACL